MEELNEVRKTTVESFEYIKKELGELKLKAVLEDTPRSEILFHADKIINFINNLIN